MKILRILLLLLLPANIYPQLSCIARESNSIFVDKIEWLPDDQGIVVATDNAVWLYDSMLSKPQLLAQFDESSYPTIAAAPDGSIVAIGGNSLSEVLLWNTQTQTVSQTITVDADNVDNLEFSGDSSLLAVAISDNPPDSNDPEPWHYRVQIWNIGSLSLLATLENDIPWTPNLRFSPSNDSLVVAGRTWGNDYDVSMIQSWDIPSATSKELSSWFRVMGIPVTDGSIVVVASLDRYQMPDSLQIWDMRTTQQLKSIPVNRKEKIITLALNGDSSVLATGSHEGSLRLWDIKTGVEIAALLEGYDEGIHRLAFSPDAQFLIFCSYNRTTYENTMHLYDLLEGKELAFVSVVNP